jgi:hypothetical protein
MDPVLGSSIGTLQWTQYRDTVLRQAMNGANNLVHNNKVPRSYFISNALNNMIIFFIIPDKESRIPLK